MGSNPKLEAVQSLGFIVAMCLGIVLAAGFFVGARHRQMASPVAGPDEKINPNEAPAASLARLPGIGPSRARAIIRFREQSQGQGGGRPVFRAADDLQQVHGLGPATVDGIRAWLRFDPLPGATGKSAAR